MIALVINQVDNAMTITYHCGSEARSMGLSIEDFNRLNLANLLTIFKSHSEMDETQTMETIQ